MILANVRAQLGRADAQLAVRLIARGSGHAQDEAEALLADQGLDPLLDDERMLDGLLDARQGAHASLPLFSYVIVRHALKSSGESERMMADYVAAILLHFGLRQRAARINDHDDESFETLSSLGDAIEGSDATRSFLARAHLGNYALWLSGLFPDHIEQRRWHRGGPTLGYFESMGVRGFRLAAEHRLASEYGLAPLFDAAADRFPRLRRALTQVSDRHLFPHVHSPEKLMRQVQDESQWRH